MSFPKYPKYKDSGVEWLGEVPEHWEVRRLKRACRVFPSNVDKKTYDGQTPVRLCNYTDVYYNEVITSDMNLMEATASDEQIQKFTLRAGDTIITKDSETADDIAVAAYVPADLPGVVCGYHLSMLRPEIGVEGGLVKRLFDSAYVRASFAVRANGLTRVGLSQYAIDNLDLPFPPLPEQTAIAAFLDRETAKIDELVAEQRRLMELLKEKRQAVISAAVTRGITNAEFGMKNDFLSTPSQPTFATHNAKLVASGIEWLGDIPAHWEVPALGYRYHIELGKMLDQKRVTGNHLRPYLRNTDVQWGCINVDDLPQMDFSGRDLQRYGLRTGDLLVCEGGEVGRAALWIGELEECFYQKALHRLRPRDRSQNTASFLYYIFYAAVANEVFADATGKSTISHLPAENLRRYRFPHPPMSEQSAIAAYLDLATTKLDTLTAEAQRAIDLLQERRTALISAAVTGQIDVRGSVEKTETYDQ